MHSHLLPAREKHEFGRMTADILCIQVFFAKCFQFWFAQNKKGHFASSIERPLNEVRVKCVCKSCILEHSDNRLLDHNRNLQKSYLRKNIQLQVWQLLIHFCKSEIHQKPLKAFAVGSVCGTGALARRFCQLTPNFCCLPLSYCFCLMCFIAVNANELLQKLKGRR